MMIRPAKINDSKHILSLMTTSYSKNRFGEKYSQYWLDCFINSPLVFPSFVAINEEDNLIGYIVWRVRKLNENNILTIELQELTAINDNKKLAIEKKLFDESPLKIINIIKKLGINVKSKCKLDILIHHQDIENNKSVLYDIIKEEKGDFLGAFEKSDARGEMLRLYQIELNWDF